MTNSTSQSSAGSLSSEFASAAVLRHRRWRNIKDYLTKYLMAIGGLGVIVAITIIAFYLLYVVAPMFLPATISKLQDYTPPVSTQESVFYTMEEQREIAMQLTTDGVIEYFRAATGESVNRIDLAEGMDAAVTAVGRGDSDGGALAVGFADGSVRVARQVYNVTYPDGERLITPGLDYPIEREALKLVEDGRAVRRLAVEATEDGSTVAGVADDGSLHIVKVKRQENLLTQEVTLERSEGRIQLPTTDILHLLIDKRQRWLYAVDGNGLIHFYDISNARSPQLIDQQKVVATGEAVTGIDLLSGGFSLIIGDSVGGLAQWFPVRDENNNYSLQLIREFSPMKSAVTVITPEFYRKGFVVGDASGNLAIYHATAHQRVLLRTIADKPITAVGMAPRANGLLTQVNGENAISFWNVDNPHPEISFKSIWGKVWYEGRGQPEYIWQSSSASSDFEPKFSLTPLAFGTLKAAFYAMLFSIPLAILGAMYTAYFMSRRMREYVKPTIEIMEALPTVILGFLAGLWFAPFVENHLPGILMLLFFVPASIILAAWGWRYMPDGLRERVPDGWEAALLMPVIILAVWAAVALSAPVEVLLFDGNMPFWLTRELGIPYEQRNSLVVGFAMGFAVIPTIFSISEDALYSVPKTLTIGSLALGATSWQTMTRVVLLTASPGIFSGVMIGFGRAVGETMIVVMATGNTAVMDLNIFQGFRAMSANIAVEMPETAVNSSHYRILFLAGLVLFLATFFLNTIAELVRQRLRNRYSSL
ncbi:MAG: ABC transporter permease subunit [Gammaproteobacteria bacterium]